MLLQVSDQNLTTSTTTIIIVILVLSFHSDKLHCSKYHTRLKNSPHFHKVFTIFYSLLHVRPNIHQEKICELSYSKSYFLGTREDEGGLSPNENNLFWPPTFFPNTFERMNAPTGLVFPFVLVLILFHLFLISDLTYRM